MWAPRSNKSVAGCPSWRLGKLGIVLRAPAEALRPNVEASDTGNLRFLSGTLSMVNGKLAVAGGLVENLLVKEGQEAARVASLTRWQWRSNIFLSRCWSSFVGGVAPRYSRAPSRPSGCRARQVPEFDNLASSLGCRRREVRSSSTVHSQALSLRSRVFGRGIGPSSPKVVEQSSSLVAQKSDHLVNSELTFQKRCSRRDSEKQATAQDIMSETSTDKRLLTPRSDGGH